MSEASTPAEQSTVLDKAALWLADQHPEPSQPIPLLRGRFGLSTIQATEACAMARKFRIYRKAAS